MFRIVLLFVCESWARRRPSPRNLWCSRHQKQREGNVLLIAVEQLRPENTQRLRGRSRWFLAVVGFRLVFISTSACYYSSYQISILQLSASGWQKGSWGMEETGMKRATCNPMVSVTFSSWFTTAGR